MREIPTDSRLRRLESRQRVAASPGKLGEMASMDRPLDGMYLRDQRGPGVYRLTVAGGALVITKVR